MENNDNNLKEKYAEFESAIKGCALKFADKLGLTEVKESEGSHGIWVHMASSLEKEIGNKCISQFKATSPDSEYILGFRHRFSDLCVSLKKKRKNPRDRETFAEIEFSTSWWDMEDLDCDSEKNWKHLHTTGGEWRFSETTVWDGDKGFALLDMLLEFFRKELGNRVQW